MECPKCGYLGFDEAPRCRNCSYDFALASTGHDLAFDEIDRAIGDAEGRGRAADDPAWAALGALDPDAPAAEGRQAFDASDLDALLLKGESTGLPSAEPVALTIDAPSPAPALPDVDLDALLPESAAPAWEPDGALGRVIDAPLDAMADRAPELVPDPAPDVLSWPVTPPVPNPPSSTLRTWTDVLPADPPAPARPIVRPAPDRPAPDMAALDAVGPERPATPSAAAGHVDDDRPLVKLQQPRAPVAVRKTPMSPKLRAVSRPTPQEPAFDFLDHADRATPAFGSVEEGDPAASAAAFESSPPLRRLAATAIDAVLFAGIDLAVLYLTFRIVGLTMAEWRVLPIWPLALFLAGMKLSYASVFTALGGQTIGKMAAGIRVVSMDDRSVSAATAVRRTLASLVAVATAGLAYLPGLVGRERRAVHDRVSGTRVVLVPAA